MITLRRHIEITSKASSQESLAAYLSKLGVIQRIDLKEEIENNYPLKRVDVDYKSLPFKVYKNVFDLVLGQFIMIEQIFTGKDDVAKHLFDFSVLRLILRPKEDAEFDNTDQEKESLNDQNILDLDANVATSILADFTDDRNKVLFKDFAGVFYDPEAKKEEQEGDDATENENFEYKFMEQWYWYSIVRKLGGENILNYEKVYMLKMETVLPELSFLIQKAKIDKAQEFRNRVARGL
jgi:hypothetical protein